MMRSCSVRKAEHCSSIHFLGERKTKCFFALSVKSCKTSIILTQIQARVGYGSDKFIASNKTKNLSVPKGRKMRYCFSFAPQKIGSFQHTKDTKRHTNASPSVDTTNQGKPCSAVMSRLPSLFATSLLHCSTKNSSRSTDFAVLVTFRDASKGPLLHPTLATRWLEMPALLRICRHTPHTPHVFKLRLKKSGPRFV